MTIRSLLKDYKKGILKGMKFSFDDFHTLCQNPNYNSGEDKMKDSMGLNEQERREMMEGIVKSLIV